MTDPFPPDRAAPLPDPARRRDKPPATLPAPLTSFVGREEEIASVAALLRGADVRLVTLTGPGGVGKTRLAQAVARDVEGAFVDGVAFVPLAPVRDPALVGSAIARALGVQELGGQPILDLLVDHLRARRALLIVDNLEHVVAAAPLVAQLLVACPDLVVLATSRAVLRLSGEHDIDVRPLDVPAPGDVAEPIAAAKAVRLFVDRARAVQADFALTTANAPAVAAIVRRLDGLPLAIELAAARVTVLPPAALLARLERRLPLLTGGARDQPARLQTMQAAIAWSHDLLNPAEQALFRRLAVFVGGFTLEAAEAIAGVGVRGPGTADVLSPDPRPQTPDPVPPVLDALAGLVDKSLVRAVAASSDRQPRFTMLETVREFALEALAASGKEPATRNAHATFFLRLAEPLRTAAGARPEQRALIERVQADLDNVRAALAWSLDRGEAETGMRLAVAMQPYWHIRGPLGEAHDWLARALAPATTAQTPPALRADLLFAAGVIANRRLDSPRAHAVLLDCLALRRELDDATGEVDALLMLGTVALAQNDVPGAAAHFEQALAVCREAGVTPIPSVLTGFAIACHRLGDDARATALLDEALARFRQHDDAWGVGLVFLLQTAVAQDRGEQSRAAMLAGEALGVFWALRDERDTFPCFLRLAYAAADLGETEPAARLIGAAERVRAGMGVALHPDLGVALERGLALVRERLGEPRAMATIATGAGLPLADAVAEALALAERLSPAAQSAAAASPDRAGLTPRELDVIRLIAAGHADREIADALFVSRRTVTNHVASILAKLEVRSRSAAAAYAVRHGLA